MKVIILAAGEGKRLMPYTKGIPKCMVEVGNVPLINHQIEVLKKAGINDIIIIKGHCSDKINIENTKTFINEKYYETNMVYSLFCAESELNEDLIISYGDIVYSESIINNLLKSKRDISVVVDLDWKSYWEERFDNPLDDAESLKFDNKGRIIEIGRKTNNLDEISGQYIGLMKFSRTGINDLTSIYHKSKLSNKIQGKEANNAFMTDLLQSIINEGKSIWPVFTNGEWVEIDTTNDLSLEITKERIDFISKKLKKL